MGIPSLNSAILYNVSLYFNLSSREISRHHASITNIPNLIHENRHFHGQKKTLQSCLIREEGAKLR